MQTIVTHTSPDWDAIGAVWLLKRYGGLQDASVVFVNTGNPDRAAIDAAAAVVDTGRELDLERLRFDHHQLPGTTANGTCAAWQVFEHIAPNGELDYLAPLNALILNGDTGGKSYGAEWSRLTGIHALLSARKARRESDSALVAWGFSVLDDLDAHLQARRTARLALSQHIVFRSGDDLVIGLDSAPQGATFAAFEEGARLVVFHSESPDTVSVGVMRGGESQEPDAGAIVRRIIDLTNSDPLRTELTRWFCHPAGFFAGRGTAKAPDPTPLLVTVAQIASAINLAWLR